jgi:acetyl/propionyl-CoA carboxylase alpha subunit
MSKLWVNIESDSIELNQANGSWSINGKIAHPDLIRLDEYSWNMIWEGKVYHCILLDYDPVGKSWLMELNGKRVKTTLTTSMDKLLKEMGIDTQSVRKVKDLKAPMPGLIREIKVKEGDQIQAGDAVLILEAMKMENVLKAPAPVVVKSIKVQAGDKVDKNAILILFE